MITDRTGFPLHVDFFHGKTTETTTLIPMLEACLDDHDLATVTVVADAAMLSAKNLDVLDEAGISYIVADRLKKAPYTVTISDDDLEEWSQRTDTFEVVEFTKEMGKGANKKQRRVVMGFSPKRYTYDMYSLQKQKEKAEAIVAGQTTTRLPRFVTCGRNTLQVNHAAFDRALSLAGWKGYVTNLDKDSVSAEDVIGFYHQLFHIENAFRMAKTDLKAALSHWLTPESMVLIKSALGSSKACSRR